MSSVGKTADRNVDGILSHMRDYLSAREQQVVRMNPRVEKVISDVIWIHLEILKNVLQKPKVFGGEKFRVADILTGGDDVKRRALFSNSDQNSIMDEIVDRSDDAPGKKAADSIHDMRTLFRSIDPSLENLVQLIQHWVKWDLPDASDLHGFEEQVRRLSALRGIQLTEDIKKRYRHALGKSPDAEVADEDIFNMELRRLEQVAGRFCIRRNEDEPYQFIIWRDNSDTEADTEPYNYKLRQCDGVNQRLDDERRATAAKITGEQSTPVSQSEGINL